MDECKVRIIKTTDDLLSLEQHWDGLLAASVNPNIFLTFDWCSIWWQTFKNERLELNVISVWREDELVALAPLYREKGLSSSLKFMGAGAPLYPDYLNFIVKEGYEEGATEAIMNAVMSVSWDYFNISDIDEQSILLPLIKKYSQRYGRIYTKKAARCPYISLPNTYDEYSARLEREHRRKIRGTHKKVAAAFAKIEFGSWPWEDITQGLEELSRLHRKRWEQKDEAHTFEEKKYIDFHRVFCATAVKKKYVNICYLKFGPALAALIYMFHYGNKDYYYQSGFDPAFYSYRPGILLLDYVIKCAIGHQMKEFDFLRGNHSYKKEWAQEVRNTVSMLFFRKTIYGFLSFVLKYAVPKIKTTIKSTIKKESK